MSKRSEIAAMLAYPILYRTFYEPDIHYEADVNKAPRAKFKEGFEQAEKDLALTWEDIRSIIIINEKYTTMLLNSTPWDGIYTKTEYEEVLRRFNEQRKK